MCSVLFFNSFTHDTFQVPRFKPFGTLLFFSLHSTAPLLSLSPATKFKPLARSMIQRLAYPLQLLCHPLSLFWLFYN